MDFIKIYIMDIFFVLIFILCLFYYYHKGFVKTILDLFFLIVSAIVTRILSPHLVQYLLSNTDYFKGDLGEYKSNIVSVAVIFLLFSIVFKIIILIIDRIFKLPVLKTVNKFLGFVLGALCGFAVTAVLITVFKAFSVFDSGSFSEAVDNSLIIKLYSELLINLYPTINQFVQGGVN